MNRVLTPIALFLALLMAPTLAEALPPQGHATAGRMARVRQFVSRMFGRQHAKPKAAVNRAVAIKPVADSQPVKRTVPIKPTPLPTPKKNTANCASDKCQRFLRDRNSLDNDSSIEWVEGWHGVRRGNHGTAVPGIVADQGLFVSKSVSYMPQAAYWHPKKPPTPTYWTNSGAMVHFRVPKVYLETMGKWVEDSCAGNRFKHESTMKAPRSKSNPNIEILPIQVLKVYWVKGDVPEQVCPLGVDVRDKETW